MPYGQAPSGYAGGGMQGKTSLSDFLGTSNQANIGTPDVDPNAFQYGGAAGGAASRQAQLSNLGAAGADYSGTRPYQAAQNGALDMMKQQALGNDGGVAENQLKQGAASAAQAQMAGAASARGGGANLAAAQMQGMNNGANAAATANFQAGQIRAQNQQAGIQNYGQFAQGALGQQAQMAQFNAQNQTALEGLNNQVGIAQLGAQGNQQQLQSQNQLTQQAQASQQAAGNADRNAGLVGTLGGAAAGAIGALGSLSDANYKTGITPQYGGLSKMGGQAQLAGMDSHIANFSKEPAGIQTWQNVSMAKPWSPESAAAGDNAQKFFFTSDAGAKGDAVPQGGDAPAPGGDAAKDGPSDSAKASAGLDSIKKSFDSMGGAADKQSYDAMSDRMLSQGHSIYQPITSDTRAKKEAVQQSSDEKAFAKLSGDVGGARGGFEWMRPSDNAADQTLETFRPYTSFYDKEHAAENGGEKMLSPMAQLVGKGPVGGDLRKVTPDGKQVLDVPRMVGATAAVTGRLHDRVQQNERDIAALLGKAPPPSAIPNEHLRNDPEVEQSLAKSSLPAGPVRTAQLAPEEHGNFSVFDNHTRVGDQLTSDTTAKKDAIYQSGVQQGAADAMQHAAPQMSRAAAPGYQVPAVMSPAQHDLVLAQTDRGRAIGASPEEIQKHIDMAMAQAAAQRAATPSAPSRGYAPRSAQQEMVTRQSPLGAMAQRGR